MNKIKYLKDNKNINLDSFISIIKKLCYISQYDSGLFIKGFNYTNRRWYCQRWYLNGCNFAQIKIDSVLISSARLDMLFVENYKCNYDFDSKPEKFSDFLKLQILEPASESRS